MTDKVHLGRQYQTGNFWIDNGLVYLLNRWGEGEHRIEDILKDLLGSLVQPTGNKGQYYDEQSKQLREYEKRNWVEPTNLFIKVSGDPGRKVRVGDKQYPTQPPEFNLKLELSGKSAQCDICGESSYVTDAKMWVYPFVVDPAKFGNFYSGAKRGMKLCARCALAGLAGYLSWWWRRQGNDALHFFLFHTELSELQRLHREVLRPLQLAGERGGNVRPAFSGKYLHETTLGILLSLFSHIPESDALSDSARDFLMKLFEGVRIEAKPVVLYAVSGVPAQAFDMKSLREFSNLQRVYRLYLGWREAIGRENIGVNPHQQIVSIIEQFWVQRQRDRETLWRDRIAQAVLGFGDPFPTIEEFLFDVRAKEQQPRPLRFGTEQALVDYYVKEVFQMDEQFVKTLSGFGHTLGTTAQQKHEMGLLYALRNAKNVEEFYRVLNDVQFRLDLTVPESLLKLEKGERIAGSPWRRVKHMLAIYSMNAYLRQESGAQKSEKTQEG